MDKKTAIKSFNKVLTTFIKQLVAITNDSEVKRSQRVLKVFLKSDKSFPIKSFIRNMYPHKSHIVSHNEDFFLNLNVEQNSLTDVFKLKKVWPNLSEENKDVIFKYLEEMIYYIEQVDGLVDIISVSHNDLQESS